MITRQRVVRRQGWWPPRAWLRRLWPGTGRRAMRGRGAPGSAMRCSGRSAPNGHAVSAVGACGAVRGQPGGGLWYGVPRGVRRDHVAPLLRPHVDRDRGQPAARPPRGAAVGRRRRGTQRVGRGARRRAHAAAQSSVDPARAGAARVSEPADDHRAGTAAGGHRAARTGRTTSIATGVCSARCATRTAATFRSSAASMVPTADVTSPVIGMHRALQLVRWCERLNSLDAVSEIHVDRRRGVTVFPRRTAVAVVLGWGSWREKLPALGARLRSLGRTGGSVGRRWICPSVTSSS